jgi:hypothetical protein
MPNELLNEAERFLIERWGEARLLELSMEGVRTKYKELFERVIGVIADAHPELDANAVYPTQFWGPGSLGFGRKSWPAGDTRSPGRLAGVGTGKTPAFFLARLHAKSGDTYNTDNAKRTGEANGQDLPPR